MAFAGGLVKQYSSSNGSASQEEERGGHVKSKPRRCQHKPAQEVVEEEGIHDDPHAVIADMSGGGLSRTNPKKPQAFDSAVASGHYCFIHRPLDEDEAEENGDAHARYFIGKLRLWEVRFQCKFKRTVKANSLRFSTAPYERLPVSAVQVATQRAALRLGGRMLGGLYNSLGDDPKNASSNFEVECPCCSIPFSELDQHVVTEPGEVPPNLLEPSFPSLGRFKKDDRKLFRQIIGECTFQAGETHSFSSSIATIRFRDSGDSLRGSGKKRTVKPRFRFVSMDRPRVLAILILFWAKARDETITNESNMPLSYLW